MSRSRQSLIGLSLAALIVGGWTALHVLGVFFWRPTALGWALALPMVAAQSWLGAGMFIVAHDAMHGSLAPGRPRLSYAVGWTCVRLYAGFSYRRLNLAHHQHHAAPGSADDPDFHHAAPDRFWPWFVAFFRRYFGWREFAVVSGLLGIYLLVLGAEPLNAGLFWGLPAILSALQLFVFGTWLPHRHVEGRPFADQHNARTLDLGWWASLFSCFHFGYHEEHHLRPEAPWWRLPAVRAGRA